MDRRHPNQSLSTLPIWEGPGTLQHMQPTSIKFFNLKVVHFPPERYQDFVKVRAWGENPSVKDDDFREGDP
ncbi:hypothetical protein M413DRAFT_449663 [Hebeloma cylindrosporum]|uniref:Uncharacterized protein n=1 Tax=Hebeloma cylindrosporum TaxID=76867 RepID=A0A0C2XCJ5_HEBCY|nr:hypothetical protein M413DRAFT_449663 [Hebeloma cylindrosporum h7]